MNHNLEVLYAYSRVVCKQAVHCSHTLLYAMTQRVDLELCKCCELEWFLLGEATRSNRS